MAYIQGKAVQEGPKQKFQKEKKKKEKKAIRRLLSPSVTASLRAKPESRNSRYYVHCYDSVLTFLDREQK